MDQACNRAHCNGCNITCKTWWKERHRDAWACITSNCTAPLVFEHDVTKSQKSSLMKSVKSFTLSSDSTKYVISDVTVNAFITALLSNLKAATCIVTDTDTKEEAKHFNQPLLREIVHRKSRMRCCRCSLNFQTSVAP